MTHSRVLVASLVLGGLTGSLLLGCATKEKSPARSTAEVVAERQRLMKLKGASMRDIQEKARAGNVEGIAVNAETLAINARLLPALFPEGSIAADSRAKPEIWSKRSEFEAAAKNLETQAGRLRDTARTKDAEATQTILRDFVRNSCDTCHTPFRVPPRT